MNRRLGRALAAAVVTIAALTACGGHALRSTASSPSTSSPLGSPPRRGTSRAAGGRLTVTPAVAGQRSVIRFGFGAPAPSGRRHGDDISYALRVVGPQRAGCVGTHAMSLARIRRGQSVSVSLGPVQLGGRWCTGTFSARVYEFQRPICGGTQMCPQFIAVLAEFGPATFRVQD